VKIEGSAHLDSAEYHAAERRLHVTFKSGLTYAYTNVPADVWESFQKAESKGQYLHEHIKPKFRAWRSVHRVNGSPKEG
jgi:hypothetical protein